MHRLVIIGSLEENIELVKESKRRGYYTIVCDGYPDGPAKAFADRSYDINVNNVEEIAQMCIEEKADGIIGSFSDLVFERITEIAHIAHLNWYGNVDTLKYYRDKSEAKKLMNSAGISVPGFTKLVDGFKDEELDHMSFPMVIKPISGWGSKGIEVVKDISEIREHIKADRLPSGYIVEEYINSDEHNCIAWVVDGTVHIISLGDRNRNPQEGKRVPLLNRVVYPSKHLDILLPPVQDTLQRFVDATGQRSGPLCMQFFRDGDGIKVCEIAGRILGHEHPMISRYSGISIVGLLLDMTYEPEQVVKAFEGYHPSKDNPCAGLYFMCRNGFAVEDQSAAIEIANDSHVFGSVLYYDRGETVDSTGTRSYFAKYFINGKDRESLDALTESFFAKWHIYSADGEDIAIQFILER